MTPTDAPAKTAVVTGASSGIGEATARHLLAAGWHVSGMSRRRPEIDDAAFTWVEVDLGDFDHLACAASALGVTDAVVHAAGLQHAAPLGALDPAHSEQMWRIHVGAAEILVDALAPTMRHGARIVLLGSRTMTGNPGKSQYAATKAALAGMARSWAAELLGRAITVNVVAPGPTDTPMLTDPARRRVPPRLPPLGRFIEPAEVAALIGFLLGPHGGSITGQTILQCAGSSL